MRKSIFVNLDNAEGSGRYVATKGLTRKKSIFLVPDDLDYKLIMEGLNFLHFYIYILESSIFRPDCHRKLG